MDNMTKQLLCRLMACQFVVPFNYAVKAARILAGIALLAVSLGKTGNFEGGGNGFKRILGD